MSTSWLRQLFRKRAARTAPAGHRRTKLTAELLEDRALLAVAVWDGEGGLLQTPNYNWSLPLNWVGNAPPQPGDDVVFPAGLSGGQKPAPSIGNLNGVPFLIFQPNVIIDGDYVVNNLSVLDQGYRIDAANPTALSGTIPPRQLTVQGELFANIQPALGTLTGLSLIGPQGVNQTPNGTFSTNPLVPTGQSSLRLRFTSSAQSLNVVGNGVLEISAPITQDPVTPPVGGVGLLKVGGGRLALSGANSFTGSVVVSAGQLDVAGPNALGTSGPSANGTTVAAGATLGFAGGAITESLQIAGNGRGGIGALSKVDRPLLTYANIGGTVVNGQVIPADTTNGPQNPILTSIFPGPADWAGGIAMVPSAAVGGVRLVDSFTISGQITGSGDLTKVGAGALTLTNANNYTGQTLINVGTVVITNNNALSPGSSTTVADGATLALAGGLTVAEPLFVRGLGQFVDGNGNPTGALRLLTGSSTYTGLINLQADTAVGAANGATLTVALFDDQARSTLRKVDQGTLVLPNANANFSGDTRVENGVLLVRDPLALGPASGGGNGAVAVTSIQAPGGTVNGTLRIQPTSGAPFTFAKALTLAGPGFASGGSLNILDAVPGTTGSNVVLSGGVLLAGATSLDVAGLSSLRVASVISSAGVGGPNASLTRTGAGTLFLDGANTYLGQTNLAAGRTVISTPTALGAANGQGTVVSNGAALEFAVPLAITENLTLSGSGILGGGALVAPAGVSSVSGLIVLQGGVTSLVDVSVAGGGALSLSGAVSGPADLRKIGGGDLRLTGPGTNSYVGTTFINQGRLILAKPAGVDALSGPVVVGDGLGGDSVDALVYEASDQIPTLRPNVTPLQVTVNSSGIIQLNGFSDTLSGLTLTGGVVTTAALVNPAAVGTLTLAGDVQVNSSPEVSSISGRLSLGEAARTFNVADGPQATDLLLDAAVVGGPGGLIKDGTGTLVLASTLNAYAGPTTVAFGTLRLGQSDVLPDTTALTLGGTSSTLDLAGRSDAVASLAGSGTVVVNGGQLISGGSGASTTFAGAVTNGSTPGGVFRKVGGGVLSLTGASPGFTGTLAVDGGVVELGASYAGAAATVAAGAALTSVGTAGAVGGVTVARGGLLSTGGSGTAGALAANGPVALAEGSVFAVDILGVAAGTQYDQLTTTGPASLNSATLAVNPGTFVPGPGDVLTLLTAAGGVSGVFRDAAGRDLVEGSALFLNGRAYTISYLGNGGRNVTLTVSRAATIGLASGANPSGPGQPVTFTATLTPQRAGDPAPTGTVTFRLADGTVLGTPNRPLVGGVATSDPVANLPLGNNTVIAEYTPGGAAPVVIPTSASLVQQVNVASSTTIAALSGPTVFGDAANFLVTVAQVPGAPAPTGTVTLVEAATGRVLGSGTLNANGQAVVATTGLRPGATAVRADYAGSPVYRASSSAPVTQQVDRQNRVAVGTDAGPVATVQVFDPRTGGLLGRIVPFDGYTLGVKVAVGDVNNDGVADIVVSAGAGAPGGHVKVYDGVTLAETASFFTFPGFTGGVNVAVGDVNADGFGDIIVGTAVADTHVRAFSGADPARELLSFFAFGQGNPVGVTVGSGDVDGDGRADVIVGSALSAGHVKVFSGTANGRELASFFAYGTGYQGGIFVAAGDLDGDGRAEVITGASNAPHVKALTRDGVERASFFAYTDDTGAPVLFGVRVAAADRDGDRLADILTGAGSAAPAVKAFSGLDPSRLIESLLLATDDARSATTGVFVAGSSR